MSQQTSKINKQSYCYFFTVLFTCFSGPCRRGMVDLCPFAGWVVMAEFRRVAADRVTCQSRLHVDAAAHRTPFRQFTLAVRLFFWNLAVKSCGREVFGFWVWNRLYGIWFFVWDLYFYGHVSSAFLNWILWINQFFFSVQWFGLMVILCIFLDWLTMDLFIYKIFLFVS